jgi:hypothetical protein
MMGYKYKDYLGVFLISGGKNSILALDMLHLEFINRIGIVIDIDNCTIFDSEYLNFLQKKYNMTILRLNFYKNSYEDFLLNEVDDLNEFIKLSHPIYRSLSEIRKFIFTLQVTNYKVILGSNKNNTLYFKESKSLLNPLVEMTIDEVENECKKRDLKLVNTYEKGFSKHDSFPCISWASTKNIDSLKQNIDLLKKYYPSRYEYWCEWEKKYNISFFKTDNEKFKWLHKI